MRRQELDLSQEQVAKKLSCDYSTYGKLENGRTALSVDRLIKLAEILDTEVSTLLGDKNNALNEKNKRYKVVVEFDMSAEEFAKTGLDKKINSKS